MEDVKRAIIRVVKVAIASAIVAFVQSVISGVENEFKSVVDVLKQYGIWTALILGITKFLKSKGIDLKIL